MGTPQSRSAINGPAIFAAENESDDEFTDCTEEFEDLGADISEGVVKSDDEIEKNSKPLETSSNSSDDVARSQTKLGCKQIVSDDEDDESFEERKERQRKEMEDFREEMIKKRELRQQCVKKLREELIDLREKLSSEMDANAQLRETLEQHGVTKSLEELSDENKKLKVELAECQLFLQTSNSENIHTTLENRALRDQARSLKEAVSALKEMLKIRECQVDQMKSKLTEIEASFAEKETKIMSTALQQEYQRQLENIRNMRQLYEERASIHLQEREALQQKLDDKEHDLKTEVEKSRNLEEYISTLEDNVKSKNSDIGHLESEIGLLKSEKAQVASEMSAVNQLIAQVLFGFSADGSHIDIDKLVLMLEQNRDLLNEMAIKEDYAGIDEGSFLPKLLFDLFLQANQGASEAKPADALVASSPEEIAEKLPKVWRVLIELLSHHKKLNEDEERVLDDCYKSVQTASGTQNVLSVSKTFIKLKDLILEKRSLQKDTTRLKTLYSHLEQRLDKQEKRLSTVSLELTKTWHLVGKIKRQNRQLHTHEQILCYQLQQKRRLLNELKAELEYCRKKWALARALNNESEEQCKQLRHEFSMRKIQDQNSAESGYSDEHPSDGDDFEAGPSSSVPKVQKFDANLMMFDRTASPAFSERRQSASPTIHDFSALCLFSRAQSEPPRIPTGMNDETDSETFEVLDLVPDPILERCIASPIEEPDRRDVGLVVTPPPEILVFSPPKLKAHLRKHKKDKKRKANAKDKAESAEEMFLRLTGGTKSECSTSSSITTNSYEDDELDSENVEEIQEIPMDESMSEIISEDCAISLKVEEDEIVEETKVGENSKIDEDPQPPPPVPKEDDISILSEKEQEYLKRREARLKRLEEDAQAFYERMARNKDKGVKLDNHINDIHQNFLDRHKERAKSEDEKAKDEPSTSGEGKKKVDEPEAEQKDD